MEKLQTSNFSISRNKQTNKNQKTNNNNNNNKNNNNKQTNKQKTLRLMFATYDLRMNIKIIM